MHLDALFRRYFTTRAPPGSSKVKIGRSHVEKGFDDLIGASISTQNNKVWHIFHIICNRPDK